MTTKCSQFKMMAPDGKLRETSEIYKTWSGMNASEYKAYKNIRYVDSLKKIENKE